jgi:hypothetical protein
MAQALAHVAASWNVPPWAEVSDSDEEAVVHSRRVGTLLDLDGRELAVDLVQRDELLLTAAGPTIVREPAWVRVAGVRIGQDQTVQFARMLLSARELAELAEPTSSSLAVKPSAVDRIPRDRTAPDQSAPDQSAPDRSAPDQSMPDRSARQPGIDSAAVRVLELVAGDGDERHSG